MRHAFILSLCVVAAWGVAAQEPQAPAGREQYKRFHPAILEVGLEGDWAQALVMAEELEARLPDEETAFTHAVALAHLDRPGEAVARCREALRRGLPEGRLAAERHNLLAPLAGEAAFQGLIRHDLVHGPMLGVLTPTGAKVWVRTAREVPVELRAVPGDGGEAQSFQARTRAEQDFTAVIDLHGLAPATEYHYELVVDGEAHRDVAWRFRTPAAEDVDTVRFAFGGGAGYTPDNERMWDVIRSQEPEMLLLLGDNVYIDHPTLPEMQRYCYYRRQSRPEFRRLVAQVPVYAIWDDHDFSTNDSWGGPEIDEPAWKRPVWEVFRQNWVNPAYGGGETNPGCWFRFTWGPAEFFMIDGRYYRTDPEEPNPTMLGPVQKRWLLDAIAQSTAPIKVFASNVPVASGTKPGSLDTWDGYADEREEVLRALDEHAADGLLILSADRHRSDIWKITRPGGRVVYEVSSSRLTNQHVHRTMDEAEFSYNALQSFALVELSASGAGAEVGIITIEGEVVHQKEYPLAGAR
jgi:alkaline phosphatase D